MTNKELLPLDAWKEVKDYIDYCFGYKICCKAMTHMSTSVYLEPFLEKIETTLKKSVEDEKKLLAFDIIIKKRVEISNFLWAKTRKQYNSCVCEEDKKLTKEEFKLLEKVLRYYYEIS